MQARARLTAIRDDEFKTGYANTKTELERIDRRKMNLQLKANEENKDRAECGKNEAGRMKAFVSRACKHVGNATAHDRSNDAEHDRPEECHMHMHHRFRDNPRDQPDENIPD